MASITTACPAAELQAQAQQAAVNSAFKLLSANGDCEMTPVNGGPTLSFSRDCITIDKENMQLITPDGKQYKILPVPGDQSKFLLQGEDGTIYTPNVTLCVGILLGLAAAAAVAGICYLGYKAYKCGCRVVSNYNNRLSNSSSIVYSPMATTKIKTQDASGPMPIPLLSDLTATGSATHTFGLPPSLLKVPSGYVLSFDTNSWLIDTNFANTNLFFQDQTVVGNTTDIFGNNAQVRLLIVVNPANSYLVNIGTGVGVPCMVQTSSDLVHWQNMDSVSLSYVSVDRNLNVLSLTSVTMTPDLQPYATNWYHFDGNGTVVESYSLSTPVGIPTTAQQQFIRLGSP
jgi:hypothetical protein